MKFVFDMRDDSPPPAPGDLLLPTPPRRTQYQVQVVRPVESRVHPYRWCLDVKRVYLNRHETGCEPIGDGRVWRDT